MTFIEYLGIIELAEQQNNQQADFIRFQELAGIVQTKFLDRYIIKVTVEGDRESDLLLEYDQYKQFMGSRNLYYKHAEDHIVKAHYHVVHSKTKEEIYAVNMDGTAHHRKNKGFKVPEKEAKELTKLGVQFKTGNILEIVNNSMHDSTAENIFTFFFIIEG